VATTLMTFTGVAMGPTLTVLAAVSALGAVFALRLPGNSDVVPAPHLPSGADARVRARR